MGAKNLAGCNIYDTTYPFVRGWTFICNFSISFFRYISISQCFSLKISLEINELKNTM